MSDKATEPAQTGEPAKPGDLTKPIGVTMAILGVALAICSSMVGSNSTDLIRTMVDQSNKIGFYHTETMKFRVAQGNYELLKSITPKPDEVREVEQTLRNKRKPSGSLDSEDTAELKDLIASSTEDMADFLTPDPEETAKFRKIAKDYERDMRDAKEDAEAYDLEIETHREASASWHRAQLLAEIGIVVAAVALLTASRRIWAVAIVCGVACAALSGYTFAHTRAQLAIAESKIKDAAQSAVKLEADDVEPGAADKRPNPASRPTL